MECVHLKEVATILKSRAAHDEKDEICLFAKRPADHRSIQKHDYSSTHYIYI
jgi:hypothetical protein